MVLARPPEVALARRAVAALAGRLAVVALVDPHLRRRLDRRHLVGLRRRHRMLLPSPTCSASPLSCVRSSTLTRLHTPRMTRRPTVLRASRCPRGL